MPGNGTLVGRYVGLLVETATPGQYASMALGTVSKELTKSLNMGSQKVAHKTDPTAVTVDEQWVISKAPRSMSLEAEFTITTHAEADAWHEATVRKNIQLVLYDEDDGETIEGYYAGSAWMSEVGLGAPDDGLVTSSCSLAIYGEFPFTVGAPS